MALTAANNIFEQYGIKEVADVQFEEIKSGEVVLYLDTLKVSTLETTAEQTEAKGGKGNPPLIIWDFGKEINVVLQDALFTQASLALVNGVVVNSTATVNVRKTEELVASTTTTLTKVPSSSVRYINLTKGNRGIINSTSSSVALASMSGATAGDKIKFFYDVSATAGQNYTVTINANTFPSTYKVIGDTFIRNRDGEDIGYQFVIERAKIDSNSTITMEAEGDPAVFDMNLRVLRADNGSMIKFIKYAI